MKATSTVCLIALTVFVGTSLVNADATEHRAKIDAIEQETLEVLYQAHPAAKDEMGGAYGYAVFDISQEWGNVTAGDKQGGGAGVAVHGSDRTYMKSAAAPDTELRQYQVVLLFKTREAFDDFTDGFSFGSSKKVAKEAGIDVDSGFVGGIKAYELHLGQMTEQARIANTRYHPSDKLND